MTSARSHMADRDLLFLADGEYNGRHAAILQNHLRSCWDCRTRMGEMESTIEAFVASRRHLFEHKTQDPRLRTHAASREALLRRVRAAETGQPWWSVLTQFLPKRWMWRNPITLTTAVGLVATLLLLQIRPASLNATELVLKSEAWELAKAGSAGKSLHRKFSIIERRRNTPVRRHAVEVWSNPRTHAKVSLLFDENGARLSEAQLGAVLPALSADNAWQFEPASATFLAVAEALGQVRTASQANTFRLSAPAIELSLDRETYRPISETLRVDGAEFEFSESGETSTTEMLMVSALSVAPAPEVPARGPDAITAPAPNPRVVTAEELDTAEIAARKGLHRLNADFGEAVRIERHEQEIEIAGVVDSRARKDQMIAAFRDVPNIRVSLLCPEDATADAVAQALATPPATTETRPPLLESWLNDHFPQRVEGQAWVRRVLQETNTCLQHAHALADLEARYGRGSVPDALAVVYEDHHQGLRASWVLLAATLGPLIAADGTTPAAVSATPQFLLGDLRVLQRDLSAVLAGGQGGGPPSSALELVEDARAKVREIGSIISAL